MQEIIPGNSPSGTLEFLSGGGEMGERIRNYNWSATSLGPIEYWPKSLRTCIRIMLTSRQPIWIGWGQELVKFYNDPYKAIVGGKHPWALGKPASVVWKDIWKDIDPMLRQVMEKDEGTYVESQLLIMERNGYPEETYYTFSYTPIPGDNGKTEGMFCANTDDTGKITSERQLKTLTRLGKRLVDCKNTGEIIQRTIDTLSENPQDFPFALFRTISKGKAVLAFSTPLGGAENIIEKEVELNSASSIAACMNTALETRKPQVFEGTIPGLRELPKGVWAISSERTLVLPVIQPGKDPYGLLIVGLNPYRLLDEKYADFFSLLADQVATSFSDVHVLEEERKRAEALAEVDRAKTTFFSNISHEFRTPLTLLLGPIEEIANDPGTNEENKIRSNAAYRNALRLQRLVNTLLEFSRIEAGRMEGKFSRVDICSFTKDLASIFRSAVEKAGMQLRITCSEVRSEVYVDTDMWEKIVLNLISNAFKYTKAGAIDINVLEADGNIMLSVSDTGVGVPEEHLEKIFDRFHRIENIQGRSQEGTGIGLALVRELVKLHNGNITVASQHGKGSTFTVTIPAGKEHLLPSKIMNGNDAVAVSKNSVAFVEEAMKWIPEEMPARGEASSHIPAWENNLFTVKKGEKKFRVVLADDNADMREYMHRLLAARFEVISAVDGEDAFDKVLHNNPDLLISDIMMPKLDGFGLLKKLRSHPDRKNLPVIFLSARAGEEATVEGLEAGADDYLIKPFSARELIARVESQIKLKEIREAALKQLYSLFDEVPFAVSVLMGESLKIDFINQFNLRIWQLPKEAVAGRSLYDVFPGNREAIKHIHQEIYRTGKRFIANELPIELWMDGKVETRWFNTVVDLLRNENDQVVGQISTAIEITEQVLARKKIEENEKNLRSLVLQSPTGICVIDASTLVIEIVNDQFIHIAGKPYEAIIGKMYWDAFAEIRASYEATLQKVINEGEAFYANEVELMMVRHGKEEKFHVSFVYQPMKDLDGIVRKVTIWLVENTGQVLARKKLQESETRFQNLVRDASVAIVVLTGDEMKVEIVNEAYARILERTTAELLGKPLFGVIPDAAPYYFPMLEKVYKTGEAVYLYDSPYSIKKDGKEITGFLNVVYEPYRDGEGNRIGVMAILQDVTGQVQAKKKLEESEKHLELLSDTVPAMIFYLDTEQRYRSYNETFMKWFSIDDREAIGKTVQEFIGREAYRKVTPHLARAYTGQQVRYEMESPSKIGKRSWLSIVYTPHINEEGRVLGIIVHATDITHSKETEIALRESERRYRYLNETLEAQVSQRTAELQRSNEDLQQFAHVASHDLKEPVRKIRTFGNRLGHEFSGILPERAKTYIAKMESAADRMATMIDGVLNYSTINASTQTLQQVDLNEVIKSIETDLEVIILNTGTIIEYSGLPTVEGAHVLLYQLFYNLVNNSIKFAKAGVSPRIVISSERMMVNDKIFCRILVKDNGIGFEESYSKSIFDTFTRLNSKDKYDGTGLGLSLCKKIVERHGGTIEASGVKDEGATISVLLPLQQTTETI